MTSVSPMVATRVAAPVASSPGDRHLLMLHGIYGRGRNWLAVARGLVAQRPDWTCWLADMRHHGDAQPGVQPGVAAGSLDALAGDIETWSAASGVVPEAVLGHSYGGKVALSYTHRQAQRPLQAWVVDSTPEAKAPPSGSAWQMLETVRRMPSLFTSRAEAIGGIEAGGFSADVAQWMSTNLARDGDQFRWRLDFDVMELLLRDFFETNLWHVLDPGAASHDVRVLKASQSSVISEVAMRRLTDLAAHPRGGRARVHVDQREGGHWIHAESPEVVIAWLAEGLVR